MGKPIGQALAEWAEMQEHQPMLDDVRRLISQQLGRTLNDSLMAELRAAVAVIHQDHCDLVGRRLRPVALKANYDFAQIDVTLLLHGDSSEEA